MSESDKVFDTIIVGAGLSGLQTARRLIDEHGISEQDILLLEAQDYVGGRVKQDTQFVKNVKIDLGAEIIHGNNTALTKVAQQANESFTPAFCWAHGDGGPFEAAVDGYYGLYYVGTGESRRLLRYDDQEPEFVRLNNILKDIGDLDDKKIESHVSLSDYLRSEGFSTEMVMLAEAGFSNTFCTSSDNMSFKQAVRYTLMWHGKEEDEGEFRFKNTYCGIVNFLKKGLNIKLNTPVALIDNSEGYHDEPVAFSTASDSTQKRTSQRKLVTVTTTTGVVYRTRSVVVTASPPVLLSNQLLKFNPPLPQLKIDALQSLDMHRAMKIILQFKQRAWPKQVQGMIMSCDNCLVPEMWFRDVSSYDQDTREKLLSIGEINIETEPTCIASAFCTGAYADRLIAMNEEERYQAVLAQMDDVFEHLQPRHMSDQPSDEDTKPLDLPKPSSVFIKAMTHDWKRYPYIGGGYSCARVGWSEAVGNHIADVIDQGSSGAIFFAGEAMNVLRPAGTAHAALETGERAAKEVSAYLDLYFD